MVIFWDSRIQTIFPRLALRLPVMDLPLHCAHSVATQVRRTVAMKRWWASNIARLFQTGAASRLAQRWAVVNTTENLTNTKGDRKSTRLNSSHGYISYAVFCLKKKTTHEINMKA